MIKFKNIPDSDKPRERLYNYGSENLSNEELISKLKELVGEDKVKIK